MIDTFRIHKDRDSANDCIWKVFKNEELYAMFRDEQEANEYVDRMKSGKPISSYFLHGTNQERKESP